jgi:tRNA dihydrouridine synthase A
LKSVRAAVRHVLFGPTKSIHDKKKKTMKKLYHVRWGFALQLLLALRRPAPGIGLARPGHHQSFTSGHTEWVSMTTPQPQRFHVAPMQAYTNRHLRMLCRTLSKKAVLWTEMEKVGDLLVSAAAADRRLSHDAAGNCVLQLGGNNIPSLQDACRLANAYSFDEVNLNCGCPSIETGGADFGATLMLDPKATGDMLRAMADVSRAPVSIKCRLAAHPRLLDDGGLPVDEYDKLSAFVDSVSTRARSVSHWVVHCRAAVLAGLSPSKNRCAHHIQSAKQQKR